MSPPASASSTRSARGATAPAATAAPARTCTARAASRHRRSRRLSTSSATAFPAPRCRRSAWGSPNAARGRRRPTCCRSSRARGTAGPGNAQRGAALYQSNGCGVVPRRRGRGGVLGPELTTHRRAARRARICARRSSSRKRRIRPGTSSCARCTTSGAEIRGIRVNEDVFWIHIRDASGTVHTLQKSDAGARRSRARGDADAVVRVAAVGARSSTIWSRTWRRCEVRNESSSESARA